MGPIRVSATRKRKLKSAALRAAIDDGDASGYARGDVFVRLRRTLKERARKRRAR